MVYVYKFVLCSRTKGQYQYNTLNQYWFVTSICTFQTQHIGYYTPQDLEAQPHTVV